MVHLKYDFESPEELEAFVAEGITALQCRQILKALKAEMRNCVKHGTPTKRDNYWYDRFWQLCKDHDVDGWEI